MSRANMCSGVQFQEVALWLFGGVASWPERLVQYSVAWQGQIEPLARAACGGGSRATPTRNTVFLFLFCTPAYLLHRCNLHLLH
jgi:hypothetical protein